MYYVNYYESPIGRLSLYSDGEKLTGLWMDNQKYDRYTLKCGQKTGEQGPDIEENTELPVFLQTRHWLDLYFQGKDPGFTPALKVESTAFRQQVAEIMLQIPFGKTMTYGEIAQMMAKKRGKKSMSAQAVGGAVGHNPIGIIIPCHRVLGADGSLTGYAGGLWRKEYLLKNEKISFRTKEEL